MKVGQIVTTILCTFQASFFMNIRLNGFFQFNMKLLQGQTRRQRERARHWLEEGERMGKEREKDREREVSFMLAFTLAYRSPWVIKALG